MGEPRLPRTGGLRHQHHRAQAREEERERLFKEVRAGRERLRSLAQRLVEVQEVERRNLVRRLHDEIGQNLTGLSINLNILRSQLFKIVI